MILCFQCEVERLTLGIRIGGCHGGVIHIRIRTPIPDPGSCLARVAESPYTAIFDISGSLEPDLGLWVSMQYDPANPLIVQGDRTVLLEVDNPHYSEARDALAPFAELEKSPEHIHTYRLTNLSLWNAAAAGHTADEMVEVLRKYSKFPLPNNLGADIEELVSRYGRVKLERFEDKLRLVCPDLPLL